MNGSIQGSMITLNKPKTQIKKNETQFKMRL